MLLLLLACADPDPDALLREGRLDDAMRAQAARGGRTAPTTHHTATVLAKRAQRESWITMPVLVEWTEAAALLDSAPATRTESLDVSFEAWAPMADCTAGRLTAPWRVVVGRSDVPADPDPLETGRPFENVPYKNGRVVGTAAVLEPAAADAGRAALRSLFASVDANPPTHRVTVLIADTGGNLAVNLTRREGVWWTVSANDADAGAQWIVACGAAK